MAKLDSGPTIATTNSTRGRCDSDERFETPPKMKSVIEVASRPCALATSEWASSWTSTDANSSSAAVMPRIQCSVASRSRRANGK
jgi:hypothetical protein